ncbi:hypothetical protein COOONC_11901 [Cooperia oncophora]
MRQFLHLLEELSIPLLVFSAGITDIIEEAIRQLLGAHSRQPNDSSKQKCFLMRRTNVVVIGDSESDASMVDGWQEKKILKIGVLEEEMPLLKAFDIVITSSDCNRLNDLIRYLTSPQQL